MTEQHTTEQKFTSLFMGYYEQNLNTKIRREFVNAALVLGRVSPDLFGPSLIREAVKLVDSHQGQLSEKAAIDNHLLNGILRLYPEHITYALDLTNGNGDGIASHARLSVMLAKEGDALYNKPRSLGSTPFIIYPHKAVEACEPMRSVEAIIDLFQHLAQGHEHALNR